MRDIVRNRLKSSFEVLTNVAMLAAAGALLWTTLGASPPAPAPGPARPPAPAIGGGYSIGDRLPGLDGREFQDSRRTLILYLASTCRFCTESMEFYKKLSVQRGQVRLVAMGFEPESKLSDYVLTHGVKPDRVISVNPGQLKFRGTPTILLIDQTGVVLNTWRGRLDPRREEEVLASLQ